jgi:transmembrane sensor
VSKRTGAEIVNELAWRERRLVFRGTPIAEVAAEFNRYNRVQIRIEGAAVQSKQVSGIFDVDRPQSIVLFASEDHSLVVQPDGDDWVIRAR